LKRNYQNTWRDIILLYLKTNDPNAWKDKYFDTLKDKYSNALYFIILIKKWSIQEQFIYLKITT